MKTTAEKIKVMQAYEDGKTVKVKVQGEGKWWIMTCKTPAWDWVGNDYEISLKLEDSAKIYAQSIVEKNWPSILHASTLDEKREVLITAYTAGYSKAREGNLEGKS